MDWRDHIDRDPAVLSGKPKIRGTRISVELILSRLGEGWTADQLIDAYPHVTAEQMQACAAFAANALATDDVLDVPVSAV
jgi:uncharacterized protein (DUF433 family)